MNAWTAASEGAPAIIQPNAFGAPEGVDPRPACLSAAGVIVTYHPDALLADRIRSLIGQVGAIVVIDNGSTVDELGQLDQFVRQGVVELVLNPRNVGLGEALNQGLAWAASRGYAWTLLLDQDATPAPDLMDEAARVFDAFSARRPAVIGSGVDWRGLPCEEPGQETVMAITAGALHSVSIWQSLGGFRADFFIDYVDVEYCLRARAAGHAILRGCKATTIHDNARLSRHPVFWRSLTTTNHDRTRRYYITRNRILVWREYARREARYVASDVRAFGKELLKIALIETDRRGKLRSVTLGLLDGLRGVTGGARRI